MLVVVLVLSTFLSGLFTFIYIEDINDLFKLLILVILISITIGLAIFTYLELYSF